MTPFLVHDSAGCILRSGWVSASGSDQNLACQVQGANESVLTAEGDQRTHYVDISVAPPVVCPRPICPAEPQRTAFAADGIDAARITGLPHGTQITIRGRSYASDDGVIEWSTTMPGVVKILIEAWPYLPLYVEVAAT